MEDYLKNYHIACWWKTFKKVDREVIQLIKASDRVEDRRLSGKCGKPWPKQNEGKLEAIFLPLGRYGLEDFAPYIRLFETSSFLSLRLRGRQFPEEM